VCCRQFEGARGANHEHRCKQEVAPERTRKQSDSDHHGGQRVDTLCCANDQPPVVAICGVTNQQCKQHGRDELDQSNEPKIESAIGDLVNLPANRQGQHLVAHGRGEPRQPEQHKGPLLDKSSR
jgi:hypothetical protein